ncbi:MAG: hypothetical protein AUK47_19725 [Deltaproteobacteria bacterium CG2_30_63_29]|nr:MAG: hypothetical protein AUK47_19725 [Deltaproteobacteria bacterium CG2_30_63_29]
MKSIAAPFKRSIVLATLVLAAALTSAAVAGELSIDDRREAKAFCVEFADAITSNQGQCKAMGEALDAVVERRTELIHRVANLDDAMLKDDCNVVLAAAADALLECFDEPGVTAALDKLQQAGEESRLSQIPTAPAVAPEAVRAWGQFCDDLKATTDTFDATQPNCAEHGAALGKVVDKHQSVLQQFEIPANQASAELNHAMATCMEAFMAMPQACADDAAFVKAMQRLVPGSKP